MTRVLLGAALVLAAARAAAQGPSAEWRTVETEHFRVHYPAPFEAWALHAAGRIEAIHARVTAIVGYVPTRRIEVVVSDPVADANGEAIPFLDRPEVLLWTSPPESESSIGDFGDWMELVATHEVAHVVHLTRPRNRSARVLVILSPAPFGPLALRSPRWVIEGYATLVEGALTGSGRPNSSFRAMVLRQLGLEGKLPSYADLDDDDSWLGGSLAYLVGSAYLEWLAEREGEQVLPRLWKRMASSRGGTFGSAFRGVLGESPGTLYDRFRAELTAGALEEEKRREASGLVEGELWQRLRGGTLSLELSPDGSKLLARRDPSRTNSYLAVWTLEPTEEERRSTEALEKEEARRTSDPNEVSDRPETPAPRKPRWTLPRANGFSASDPRWLPDGRRILFSRRAPDGEGRLRWDLYVWDHEGGRVERVTCLADARDADAAPAGGWAVAVRGRYGASELVRVDLSTGTSEAIGATLPVDEDWPVWSHPRISPDGKRIAALLHAGRRWRLVTLPAGGGEASEISLGAPPVGAPSWSPDGSRLFVAVAASGTWNLASVDATGAAPERLLTRVTGGAFGPSVAAGGKELFFLDLRARGVSIRRLPLGKAALETEAVESIRLPAPFPPGEVSSPLAYDPWRSQAIRPLLDFSFGPSGNTVQLGVDGGDVLGRLHYLAMGSMGDAVGPRGGSAAAAYRGLPVVLDAQFFSAIEKPGNQGLAPRPAFDQERWGGFADASWSRPFVWGRIETRAGGGGTRVESFAEDRAFTRGLGSADVKIAFRRTRGRSGFGFDAAASGSVGATAGSGWSQWAAGGRLLGILPFATLSAAGRYGDTGGSPSLFDLYAIGGAPNAILPPGLDSNRILSPALPADIQAGRRFEAFRAELDAAVVPILLYAEWLRAWSDLRPDPVRVAGVELRLERLIPPEYGRLVTFRVGGGWIVSDMPHIRAARGYAQLIYRP